MTELRGKKKRWAKKQRRGPSRKASFAGRLIRSRWAMWLTGRFVRGAISFMQVLGPARSGRWTSAVARLFAPLFPENRLAAANLRLAFPDKSEAERRKILAGVWDCAARTMSEYVHLDAIAGRDIVTEGEGPLMVRGAEWFEALRDDGKPALVFAAHLANWELLAVIAARYGLPLVALFRPPTNLLVAEDLLARRRKVMGPLVADRRGATFELVAALERGEHVGMLADQRFQRGPRIPFFGRPARTNTLVARLARQFECPVHGARSIRLPDGRFILELTPPLDLPRDADGKIDVLGATTMISGVIEGWVREHPEQWLWLHDRWK